LEFPKARGGGKIVHATRGRVWMFFGITH